MFSWDCLGAAFQGTAAGMQERDTLQAELCLQFIGINSYISKNVIIYTCPLGDCKVSF